MAAGFLVPIPSGLRVTRGQDPQGSRSFIEFLGFAGFVPM